MNREGFLALTDAMIFIVIVFASCSILGLLHADSPEDASDPSEMLTVLESTMVRMSDLTEGDDTLVRITDLLALSTIREEPLIKGYAEDLLAGWSGGHRCGMTVEYTDIGGVAHRGEFGDPVEAARDSATGTYSVSTGGSLMVLVMLGSRSDLRYAVGEIEAYGNDIGGPDPADHAPRASDLAELRRIVTDEPLGIERHGHGVPAMVHQRARGAMIACPRASPLLRSPWRHRSS